VNTHVSAVVDSGGVRIPVEFELPYDADLAEVRGAVSGRAPADARLVEQKVTWEEPPDPDDVSDEEFLADLMAYAAELRSSGRQKGDHEAAVVEEQYT
jgi:hypothetical protein